MNAPIVPQKKEYNEEKSQKNELRLQDLFEGKKSPLKDTKEIEFFNMKRIDLLHQLNEETYISLQ